MCKQEVVLVPRQVIVNVLTFYIFAFLTFARFPCRVFHVMTHRPTALFKYHFKVPFFMEEKAEHRKYIKNRT